MLKLLLFLISIFLAAPAHFPYLEENHVIHLGEATFDKAVNEYSKGLFILYYEPACSLSRQLLPLFEQTAIELSEISRAQLAKLNCYNEPEFCEGVKKITTFPTLVLTRKDKGEFEYRGPRTVEGMKEWLNKVVDHLYPRPTTRQGIFKMFSVAIIIENRVEAVVQTYMDTFDDIEIARPQGKVRQIIRAWTTGGIYTQGGQYIQLNGPESTEEIKGHIRRILFEAKEEVPNFSAWTWQIWQGKDDFNFVMFFRTEKFEVDSEPVKLFDMIAREMGKKYQFLYVNTKNDVVGTTIGEMFGVDSEGEPAIGIATRKGGVLKKYKFDTSKDINEYNLRRFVGKFGDNELERYYMSASVVPSNKGYVQELIGSNFTQTPSKNMFVMFYFPWCDWCERLEPLWDALAYRFRKSQDLIVGRIDMSKNEVKGVERDEYPVLILYKFGQNEPAEYSDEKTMKGLMKFLEAHIEGINDVLDL